MDALIREAQVAPLRKRLSETHVAMAQGVTSLTPDPMQPPQARLAAVREAVEKQVRAELAAQMQKQLESERLRACEEGRAVAIAEAKAAAAQELAGARRELEARVATALAAIEAAHRAALSQLEAQVGEVTFAAICRLLAQRAPSREVVLGLVAQTCAELQGEGSATARLHPRDIETLRDLLVGDELRMDSLGLKVVADESLRLGGCVIEAAAGQFDGGLESQLSRLHSVLVVEAAIGREDAAAPAAARIRFGKE